MRNIAYLSSCLLGISCPYVSAQINEPAPTHIRSSNNQDGLVLEFPTLAGDEYRILGGDTPNAPTQIGLIRARGETVTLPVVSFSPETSDIPTVPVTVTVTQLMNGLLFEWTSLDDGTRKRHTVRNLILQPNIPNQYSQVFGAYRFTLIKTASLIDGPGNLALGPNDTNMIAALESAIPIFNADALNPPLSASLDPTVTTGPDKQFFRVQRTSGLTLDWDNDQLSNNREFLIGTNPFSADSDFDGIDDFEELLSLSRNPLVNERFSEVDIPSPSLLRNLAAYYDFENTLTASNGARFFPNRFQSLFPLFGFASVDSDGTASASARIEGNNQRLVLDNSTIISNANDFSISFFFRLDSGSLQNNSFNQTSGLWAYNRLLNNGASQLVVSVEAFNSAGLDALVIRSQSNSEIFFPSVNIDNGQWHHLSIVRNSSLKVYLNGVFADELTILNGAFPFGDMTFGSWIPSAQFSNTFGNIDRLLIHRRALNQAEITTLSNESKSDTDGDGIDDSVEMANGLNPLVVDPPGAVAP